MGGKEGQVYRVTRLPKRSLKECEHEHQTERANRKPKAGEK